MAITQILYENQSKVIKFLGKHDWLQKLDSQIIVQINKYFKNENLKVLLKIETTCSDDLGYRKGIEVLSYTIYTDYPLKEAIRQFNKLLEEWWLEASSPYEYYIKINTPQKYF